MQNLPSWLGPLDGKPGLFVADPDAAFPEILGAMARVSPKLERTENPADMPVDPSNPTRYDMEVALALMKKVAGKAMARHPHGNPKGNTMILRGDGARKANWRIARFDVGNKPDISRPDKVAERNRALVQFMKRLS